MSFGAIMYGGPPPDPRWDRITLPDTTPFPKGGVVLPQPIPAAPPTLDSSVANIRARVVWLERELSMHEAWKHELEVLRRMLGEYTATPTLPEPCPAPGDASRREP